MNPQKPSSSWSIYHHNRFQSFMKYLPLFLDLIKKYCIYVYTKSNLLVSLFLSLSFLTLLKFRVINRTHDRLSLYSTCCFLWTCTRTSQYNTNLSFFLHCTSFLKREKRRGKNCLYAIIDRGVWIKCIFFSFPLFP